MPGIGWECQCGKIIEEEKDFTWKFECAKLNCSGGGHSSECQQKDWEAKKDELNKIISKHTATCKQALRCAKCHKPFGHETYTKISNDPKAGDYHESCWEEVEQGRNNSNSNFTCYKCKKSISEEEKNISAKIPGNFNLYYCKVCYKEETCSKCNRFRNGGDTLCFDCRIVENNLRIPPPPIRNNGNDDLGGGGSRFRPQMPQVWQVNWFFRL